MARIIFLLTVLYSLLSCKAGDVQYRQKRCLSEEIWHSQEPLTFTDLNAAKGPLVLRIYHSDQYGFENIYLKAVSYNKSDTLYNSVFSIPLMNDNGRWIGETSGRSISTEHLLDSIISYDSAVSLDIYQYSREEVLSGVTCIEISSQKH